MTVTTNRSYTLNMYSFKNENPSFDSISESSLATLEIRTMNRYIIQLKLNHEEEDNHLYEDVDDHDRDNVLAVDDVVSPVFSRHVAIPPHVLALPTLRKLCVTEALRGFGDPEGELCESLMPEMEKFVGESAEALGFKEFGVVAEVYVTTVDVIDSQQG